MISYFDKIFVRIYNQYVKWKDQGSADLTAILLISLFQCFNVMAFIFFIGGILHGRNWTFSKIEMVIVGLIVLAFDYIRIYRIIGFKAMLERYSTQESRKVSLHPIVYFILSILILVILRVIGLYPDIK